MAGMSESELHVRKAAADRRVAVKAPGHVLANRFWPLAVGLREASEGLCSHNPIRERKGSYTKAELGLSDRLTPGRLRVAAADVTICCASW